MRPQGLLELVEQMLRLAVAVRAFEARLFIVNMDRRTISSQFKHRSNQMVLLQQRDI